MSDVTVKVANGKLTIEMPVEVKDPPTSKSGKTLVVASTHGGIKTGVKVAGGELTVSVNAYIPNPDRR